MHEEALQELVAATVAVEGVAVVELQEAHDGEYEDLASSEQGEGDALTASKPRTRTIMLCGTESIGVNPPP